MTYTPPPGYGWQPPVPYGWQNGPHRASIGQRLGALLIDSLLLTILFLPLYLAMFSGFYNDIVESIRAADEVGSGEPLQPTFGINPGLIVLLQVVSFGVGFLYYGLLVARTGQTLGRKLLGIKVVDATTGQLLPVSRAFVRYLVASLASAQICGLGYFWAIWDQHHRTWHDMASSSTVIRVR